MYSVKDFTLCEILVKSKMHFAKRNALMSVSGKGFTYQQAFERISALSSFLKNNGIVQGDKVAIVCENKPEWGLAYFAITAMGAVVVPILTDFSSAQIGNVLTHSESKLVFCSAKLFEKVQEWKSLVPIVSIETGSVLHGELSYLFNPSDTFTYESISPDSLASIIYTSGTTGHSKGVMLTHKNITYNAFASRKCLRVHRFDRLLSILPLAHAYECTIGFVYAFMQGASVFYLEKPPAPSVLIPALNAVHPTIMLSVPLVIEKTVRNNVFPKLKAMKALSIPGIRSIIYKIAGKKLIKAFGGKLRWLGIGGAALAVDIDEFLKKAHFPYSIGYGLTETSPLISGCPPNKNKPRFCGNPIIGLSVRIDSPDSVSGLGEIQVKGPTVMRGYYKDELKTKEAFTQDGWFKTGDLGIVTPDNYVGIRGRIKTMILTASGENIYPEEVETVINGMEGVLESLVYGDSDGSLVALVQIKPEFFPNLRGDIDDRIDAIGDAMSGVLETMRKEVNSKLTSFSRVKKIIFHAEAFEKTPTQKIKRYLYPKKKDEQSEGNDKNSTNEIK